jgi:putative transposase
MQGWKMQVLQEIRSVLGHIISYNGVRSSQDKLIAFKSWPITKNVNKMQSFLGFVNFYRRLIPGFARTALLLTKFLSKDAVFDSKPDFQNAFYKLRDCLLRQPVMKRIIPPCLHESRMTLLPTPLMLF